MMHAKLWIVLAVPSFALIWSSGAAGQRHCDSLFCSVDGAIAVWIALPQPRRSNKSLDSAVGGLSRRRNNHADRVVGVAIRAEARGVHL